jgi:hypothetical protein
MIPGAATASSARDVRSGAADRIARRLLRIEHAAPRSLISLRGSLVIAAIRCVLTYAVLPALAPTLGWLGVVATPLAVVLSLAAIVLSIVSLRRVWLADFRHRWPYTAFIVLVLAALIAVLASDVRTLVLTSS